MPTPEPRPIARVTTPAGDPAWLVTSYAEVKQAFLDPRLGRAHPDPEHAPRINDSILLGGAAGNYDTEDADHAQMRALLTPFFSARRMQALKPHVEALVDQLLDAMAAQAPPVDLHEALSVPLPVLVICELLGVPYADRDRFRAWTQAMADLHDRASAFSALANLNRYMQELVAVKRAALAPSTSGRGRAAVAPSTSGRGRAALAPSTSGRGRGVRDNVDLPDVISGLCAVGPERLGDQDVAWLAAMLLFAGHETTVVRIDSGAVLLMTNPEQRAALQANPAAISGVVEEVLRYSMGPGGGIPRYARQDIQADGVTIRAGEAVLLSPGDANHDPSVFAEPDHFDVRRQPNPHLSFGHGPRFCIGAPLARVELEAVFSRLIPRFPGLRLAIPVEELEYRGDLLTGGLTALPVAW